MSRTKGSKNKKTTVQPLNTELTVEERLEFLANLIVDKILADQDDSRALLKKIME